MPVNEGRPRPLNEEQQWRRRVVINVCCVSITTGQYAKDCLESGDPEVLAAFERISEFVDIKGIRSVNGIKGGSPSIPDPMRLAQDIRKCRTLHAEKSNPIVVGWDRFAAKHFIASMSGGRIAIEGLEAMAEDPDNVYRFHDLMDRIESEDLYLGDELATATTDEQRRAIMDRMIETGDPAFDWVKPAG